MRPVRPYLLASVLSSCLFGACGHENANPQDPDGGEVIGRESRPVLRGALGLDLATVESFASVSSSASSAGLAAGPIRKGLDGGVGDGGGSGGAGGLYALTLGGETLSVSLVEESNPNAQGPVREPAIDAIFATPTWVLFRAGGYTVTRPSSDGGVDSIACSTIAARRSDGALFCTAFVGSPSTWGLDHSLQTNAVGDVVFLEGGSPGSGDARVTRLSLGDAAGPSAVGITPPIAVPGWFHSNAAGDLLHVYTPSPLDPSTMALAIFPIDGSAPIPLGTRPAGLATRGAFGAPDENTFYVLVGGGNGIGFMGSIRVLTKEASGFVETEVTPNLPMVTNYGILLGLHDGIYLFSPMDHALARVFANGALVTNPSPISITGVDAFLGVNGALVSPVGGDVVFLANTPTGVKFIRHDGTTQENVPVPSDVTLTRVIFAQSGAIDFIGVRTSTLETVRGSVEPGSTSVQIETTGVLDPDRIVSFTRIR